MDDIYNIKSEDYKFFVKNLFDNMKHNFDKNNEIKIKLNKHIEITALEESNFLDNQFATSNITLIDFSLNLLLRAMLEFWNSQGYDQEYDYEDIISKYLIDDGVKVEFEDKDLDCVSVNINLIVN